MKKRLSFKEVILEKYPFVEEVIQNNTKPKYTAKLKDGYYIILTTSYEEKIILSTEKSFDTQSDLSHYLGNLNKRSKEEADKYRVPRVAFLRESLEMFRTHHEANIINRQYDLVKEELNKAYNREKALLDSLSRMHKERDLLIEKLKEFNTTKKEQTND